MLNQNFPDLLMPNLQTRGSKKRTDARDDSKLQYHLPIAVHIVQNHQDEELHGVQHRTLDEDAQNPDKT
ncbi:hypothetical protein CVT25_006366 [Psilocybe cyanescens]|uniref:Uncharacterized protein n=1 Tax=Psilocybe cyanescens TaxID=93625 RepID=A0A409W002_PSICY|nr:hypothetical protein CVT25_006366 [Psilocybe cyanescens]